MGLGRRLRKSSPDNFGLYLPEVASTAPGSLVLLGKANPALRSWAFQEGTTVQNVDKNGREIKLSGWMITEKAIAAPYLGTNQAQAEEIVRKARRIGYTLNVYNVAGEQSNQLFGRYLDETNTWIRVLSSRHEGRVLSAYFDPDVYCFVFWYLESGHVLGNLGVRSVEVAKA